MTLTYDPIRLEVFKHLFAAIPEEMGAVLRKSSYSPNIKERRDFSCALFDASGRMIAQAAHIPVHLGAMPLSVAAAVARFKTAEGAQSGDADPSDPHGLKPGDVIALNDPFRGGSHLPDITLVSPIFISVERTAKTMPDSPEEALGLFGFAANRAHHADVGGMVPGSMPIAREIYQEGVIIPPVKLVEAGEINRSAWDLLLANVRTPRERAGDLRAQLAANQRGVARLQEMVARYGSEEVGRYMDELLAYTERMTRHLLLDLPDGTYTFEDHLDDDGIGRDPVPIKVSVTIDGDSAQVEFTGSAPQQPGSVNAVYAITLSAVYYVFRCLLGLDVPNNAGALVPIRVIAPEGAIVNARSPAPVAGGNVETSQRIVDVLLGALAGAIPDRIPAASQGTMNNLTIGGMDPRSGTPRPYTYYETVGGGVGGSADGPGASAVHSHMTNTLNTPVEALEYAYPFRVLRYEIRRGSGGGGYHAGGDGIRRDLQVLAPAEASLITERRRLPPYGLQDGEPGAVGENRLLRDGEVHSLPGKGSISLKAGDTLILCTPGGGGWGKLS